MTEKLHEYLNNVTKAPLKPQQRMYILKQHNVPAMYHQLVLGSGTAKLLRFLDTKIRGAGRRWLKLPKDTTNFSY